MKITTSLFAGSASELQNCPPSALPEFAFIGRSNVGKSSLVNMLTGKKDLAKVSDTPGKTKLINFFQINTSWCLVDLPGYGYAKVSKHDRADFNESVAEYLEERPNLRCTFVLIDSRLPPQRIDLDFLQWASARAIPFALVFTKTDKLSKKALAENIARFKIGVVEFFPDELKTFSSSSKTGLGRSDILRFIDAALTELRKAG